MAPALGADVAAILGSFCGSSLLDSRFGDAAVLVVER